MALPVITGDLDDITTLPAKVRNAKPAVSPYIKFVQISLDADKVKILPGAYLTEPTKDAKTSEFTEISRELQRAGRQINANVHVKVRRVPVENPTDEDKGKIRVAFYAYKSEPKQDAAPEAAPVETPAPAAATPARTARR